MTPKEKAKELVEKYQIFSINHKQLAKQCALIAVDEVLLDKKVGYSKDIIEEKQYWLEVKQEIEKL